jgi:hypothetical protein
MKKLIGLLLGITIMVLCLSCEKLFKKDEDAGTLSGEQSPMGEVGTTVTSSSYENAGVSNFSASVIALKSGISTYTATATLKNDILKGIVGNFPGVTINGDNASITDMKMQQTREGIKCETGPGAGVLVKYESNVGDTYPIGSTGKVRTVVSKTGVDDYPYGLMLIKTIQVEENPAYLKSSSGITKVTYIANHKFGLVGVKVDFDDGTTTTFPVYNSTQND